MSQQNEKIYIETEKQYKKGTKIEIKKEVYKVILSSDILNANNSGLFLTVLEKTER